ncbi:MAG: helix-turn-helix transcriptional regulator [Candidatus Margulisbacteria bacterium]|jgi:transcriptional regulator with XRE-family HTH domain|nr:helix-turn-helix transcriptional regulator [Candidatus Margulisiibacteriota bacterium]
MDKTSVAKELKALISSELKRIRKEKGLTLEAMADQAGLEYTSFYRIYSGGNLPKLITLLQISRAYAIPMEYWFKDIENFGTAKKAGLQQKLADLDLLQTLNRLDASAKEVISKMLKSYVKKQN